MSKLKKYQVLNVLFFVLYTFLFLFEITKVCIYASHRQLWAEDYRLIYNAIMYFALFLALFVLSLIYHKTSKCRIAVFIFHIIAVIICVGRIYRNAITFSQLFFPTIDYVPPFIDKFTSLFELIYILVFSIMFISYFVYLLRSKYFKKSI